jgi:hypothetical protein
MTHAQTEAIWQDYLARTRAFTSNYRLSFNFDRMLEERQILLSLQESNLEWQEAKLVEEHVRCMHSFDGWDLSADLEELQAHVSAVEDCNTLIFQKK